MAQDIRVNKINPQQKRAAEHRATRLKSQGVGEDQAAKQALQEVAGQKRGGRGGGGNAAGEAKKATRAGRGSRKRTGSDSNASK